VKHIVDKAAKRLMNYVAEQIRMRGNLKESRTVGGLDHADSVFVRQMD
jgi:hypothetical protein